MPEERVPPEEKLLKIIESPISGGQNQAFNLKVRQKIFVPGKQSTANEKKKLVAKLLSLFSLSNITRGLVVACALLTVFEFFNFIGEQGHFNALLESLKKKPMPLIRQDGGKAVELPAASELISQAKERNIFSAFTVKEDGLTEQKAVMDAASDLKLTGIIWSDTPQAIIENTKEQKTYLLSAGDQVGQVKVKQILKDSVTIGKEDQEWVLK